ncbi:hypothetical protein [Kocuria sp. CPCC 205263]|uniref:hypothetical protein n=1 Tax=Kocuria sp. CPCC 205263 TaxID=3073555 RepID=UPI0034D5BB00
MENLEVNVQISTKLNRSHTVVGEEAIILSVLGRTEIDRQATGEQVVSVEDTVCAVHLPRGSVQPVSENLLSEVAVISRLARAALGDKVHATGRPSKATTTPSASTSSGWSSGARTTTSAFGRTAAS